MAEESGTLAEALYDFDGLREDNVPFKKGEILTIIEMDESGWWKAMNSSGRVGIFPYNYCQVRFGAEQNFPFVKAIADYNGETEEDLSFAIGDIITVLREITADWSEGKAKDGRRGRFPITFTEATGEFDADTLKEETEKWEEIEKQVAEAAQKRQKERQEAERKLKEEEEKRKKKEEAERVKREAEEEKENLKKEAAEAKKLAARLETEKLEREAELQKQHLILQQQMEKAEMERKQRELELQKQAAEAKRAAEAAERELEAARAETALLKKRQANADARKSKVILKKVTEENQRIKEKLRATVQHNDGHAPGRAPPLPKQTTFVEQDVTGGKQEEEEEEEEIVVEKKEEKKKKKKKKDEGGLQVVYLDQSQAPPEEEKKEEVEEVGSRRARRNRGKKNKLQPVKSKFAHLGGGAKCPTCGLSVGVGDKVSALGKDWHRACFTCSTCSKVLTAGEYRDHKGDPYCVNCHNKGFGISGYGYGVGAGILTPKGPQDSTKRSNGSGGTVVTESLFAGVKN